jgi:hypothetical protein
LTEFRIGILLAVNIDRSVRKIKNLKADFWTLWIFRDWRIREDIWNWVNLENAAGKIEIERKKEDSWINDSVMSTMLFTFRKSRDQTLIQFVQCQRTCNGITWQTAIAQCTTRK